jgi:hypothetical protein
MRMHRVASYHGPAQLVKAFRKDGIASLVIPLSWTSTPSATCLTAGTPP